MSGMELRNGVWSSQTRADDARKIRKLAEAIAKTTKDDAIKVSAAKIVRLARDLEDEL